MTGVADLAGAFGMAAGPFLAVVAAIAAVIAILVIAYTQSETFRTAIADLVSAVGGALKDAFKTVNDAIKSVAPGIDGIMGVFKLLGDFLGKFIVPIFKVVLVGAIKFAAEYIATFIKAVAGIANAFAGIAGAVKSAFTTVMNVIKGAINALISLWNNSLGKLKIALPKIGPFGGGTIGFPTIPQLAAGGTVYPTAGGTIARVAEAGRAERIEPLDANGLSQRDKAMIQLLAGSSSGKDMTINVYPSPGMNESELASMVSRQIAFQLRRGGA
jgi:phage-related protein